MAGFLKDPDGTLDYEVDWSAWLGTDTISTSTWAVVPPDLTVAGGPHAPSFTTTTTTVWLSGGTAGTRYRVTNHVVTADGRVDDRSFTIQVRDR